jgi:hypothetical protein
MLGWKMKERCLALHKPADYMADGFGLIVKSDCSVRGYDRMLSDGCSENMMRKPVKGNEWL